MSRCFPFPPPGYEKKDRPDDTNLLTKEKHKEKRHKKDKKDKEKREGKGKKDKERNKEKHKEKKDPKEKHKDKKEKDRDKEKRRTSDEKKIVGPPEYHNGEKLDPNCPQSNETKDSKFFVELGKRIRDEGGARENQMVQEVSATDQRRAELPRKVVDNNIGNLAEGKDKYKEKTEDDRKANGQRNKVEERGMENLVVQDFTGLDKKRVGGVARPADKDFEKQRNGKEKNKKKDSDSRGDRHKDRDREKKRKSKDKDSDKKKEKEEKAKEKEPNKEQPKLKESNKDVLDIFSTKTSYLLKESNKSSASNGNLGKRKEHERNGFLHENGIRPIKLLRPVSSSHQVVENGRKLEPCQMALHFASKGQGEANNHKVDNKISLSHPIMEIGRKLEPGQGAIHSASETQGAANNHKKYNKEPRINGLIEAQQPNVCLMKPSSAPVQAKVKVESSVKPQHPDSKYLSQILSIPKVEWSDFDDQGWLFSSKNLQAEKPTMGSSEVDGTLEVWAEALQIESADVTALPYVIPY